MDLAPPHVRALSWLGACTLAAFVVLALRHALPAPAQEGSVASIAFVTLEQPRPAPLMLRAVDDVGIDTRAMPAADAGALTLWTYGARGEIVFDDIEQFERCTEARLRRHEASDCPGADETAALTLGSSARRDIRVDPPRYRRRG